MFMKILVENAIIIARAGSLEKTLNSNLIPYDYQSYIYIYNESALAERNGLSYINDFSASQFKICMQQTFF